MGDRLKKLFKTLFVVGTCTGAGMYIMNREVNRRALEKNILKKGDGHYYPWRYGDIYYQKKGSGKTPLLLLHDASSYSSGYEWSQLTPYLSDQYTLYVVDLLGCGRSDKPAMTYTNYLYVELISDFIRDVIQTPAEIVSSGLSASFSVMTCAMHPELISRIVMINPRSLKDLAQVPDYRSRGLAGIMAIPLIGTSVYNLFNARSNLEYILDEKCFFNPFKVRGRLLNACHESSHIGEGSGRFLQASLDGRYLNWNINRVVADLSIPVLIITGQKLNKADKIVKGYTKLNACIRTASVSSSKVFPQLEEPEQTASLILDHTSNE